MPRHIFANAETGDKSCAWILNFSACYKVATPFAKWICPLPKPRPPRDAPLPDADQHSEGFRRTRAAQRSALLEDYVELIADLIADGGEARQVDIAARLGVSQPTVAKTLQRLTGEGLVAQKPYRGVFLTAEGETMARESRERHKTVEAFLLALGVDPCVARIDAEGIEHHVSAETLTAFRLHLGRKGAVKDV